MKCLNLQTWMSCCRRLKTFGQAAKAELAARGRGLPLSQQLRHIAANTLFSLHVQRMKP
jgi:hypothetical protein